MARCSTSAVLGILAALVVTATGCALLQSTPEEVPPPAPSARLFWSMSPSEHDAQLPLPRAFEPSEWLGRLVCESGDQPGWKRTFVKGTTERYEIECMTGAPLVAELDLSRPAPPAPAPLRLLSVEGRALYQLSLRAAERKDWEEALRYLSMALLLEPDEPVFRSWQVYLLYAKGRVFEALLNADMLLADVSSPIAWKYRALAARDLGLRDEVLSSLDGLLRSCTREHPLYAEAICARGMIRADGGDAGPEVEQDMKEGCALEQESCCRRLAALREARGATRRELEAARALPVKLPKAHGTAVSTPAGAAPTPKQEEASPAAGAEQSH